MTAVKEEQEDQYKREVSLSNKTFGDQEKRTDRLVERFASFEEDMEDGAHQTYCAVDFNRRESGSVIMKETDSINSWGGSTRYLSQKSANPELGPKFQSMQKMSFYEDEVNSTIDVGNKEFPSEAKSNRGVSDIYAAPRMMVNTKSVKMTDRMATDDFEKIAERENWETSEDERLRKRNKKNGNRPNLAKDWKVNI